jgi:asparagine synthase (glutamine-hydrolysing)
MCGISGCVNTDGRVADAALLDRMVSLIRHRGPDETGVYTDREAGLGHARLSIIDIACGQQPMSTQDGRFCITFNGEIFNYIELRDELVAKGHKFETRSDTEVLLHMYQEEGSACVNKLNGQWAFGIWDSKERRLFLSRDRLGVRPIVYTRTATSFLFASEVKALFAGPEVPRRIDFIALDQLFTFWFPLPPRTIFEGVFELPPGHSLTFQDGQIHIERHWEMNYCPDPVGSRSEQEYAEELWSTLVDAVRLRLRSDVPVAAYLSGGLDSSVTTAIVKHFTDRKLRTFSVTFDDPEYDESQYQDEVVRYVGTEHEEVRCSYADIARIFPDVIWHTEKPILRTAPAPLFLLSELVRNAGFKVVVTGEGSDEILGGYDIFKEAKIRAFWAAAPESRIRPHLLRRLYPYLSNIQNQSDAYLRAFFRVNPEDLNSPFFAHLPRFELTSKLKTFFSDQARAAINGAEPLAGFAKRLPADYSKWDRFLQAQFLEAMYLLPGYILSSQGDRVAMAHSVEVRLPFLDFRMVQFGSKLPPTLKMKVLNEKYLLKKAAGDYIPASVHKRHKQPYRAPEGKSFFSGKFDYVEELLSPGRLAQDGIFDSASVGMLVQKFRAGRAIGVKDNMALTGILSTQLVLDQFIRGFHFRTGKECHAHARSAVAAVRN